MAGFPYVVVQNKLKSFLGEIKRLGVPDRVNGTWLKTVGYTSSNDLSIPKVLEFIDFVDMSRKPTDKWMKFRDIENSGVVLADAIREGYSALYQIHPDAHLRSSVELQNFFRAHTEAGDNAVRRTANTFKTLCSLADYSKIQESEALSEEPDATLADADPPPKSQIANQALNPPLHMNIQIHISADAGSKQFDELFKSMAKHLYNRAVDET